MLTCAVSSHIGNSRRADLVFVPVWSWRGTFLVRMPVDGAPVLMARSKPRHRNRNWA